MTDPVPAVSVIMANRNGARYLGAAIRSLQAQTLGDWELLLVDDASSDRSLECAARFAEHDSRIQVVSQDLPRGPAAARNRALNMARGRWIAVLDSDDLMRPGRLETLVSRATADRAQIVADDLIVFSEADPYGKRFLPSAMTRGPRWIGLADFVDSNRLYSRVPGLGYLKPLMNTELLRRAGIAYNEDLTNGEDYELLARILLTGAEIRLEPSANYMYRRYAGSLSYRIKGPQIEALIEADDRLARSAAAQSRKVRMAFRRRRRSLTAMLRYDHAIVGFKRGCYASTAALCLTAPEIWPLLTRPVSARLQRLAGRLMPRANATRYPRSDHTASSSGLDADPSIANSNTVDP